LITKKTQMISAIALGVGLAMSAVPAHADEISDLKALVKELKNQVVEERSQIKDLKTQINDLSTQVTSQRKQVSDQGAQVQTQGAVLHQVAQQQQVIEQKQAAAPALAANAANPGYFAVPGTNTSVKIGGYVKLDMTDDVSSSAGSSVKFDPTSIPLDHSAAANRSGQVRFSAQESRLTFQTLTKTNSLGDVESVLQGDFEKSGSNGGDVFRLRKAYVSALGITAGQDWSTFTDNDTEPETLDFNGPVGWAATRQPLLRYTAKLPAGASLDMSMESPSGDFTAARNSTDNHLDKAPDIAARYSINPSWGHFAVAGLGRYLSNDAGVPNQNASKLVYGVLAGVGVKTFGKDQLLFQTVEGNGVGRYLEQGLGNSAVLVNNNSIKPINTWGGVVGYTHYWTDVVRSTAAYGYGHFGTPAGDTALPIKELQSVHANLIWSPISSTDIGVEYIYGYIGLSSPQTDSVTGTKTSSGAASRIQGSVKYAF